MGSLNPATAPRMKNMPTHTHGLPTPTAQATTISEETAAEAALAHSRALRRSRLSDMWPATGLTSSIGMNEANPAAPIQAADPVIWKIT